MRKTNEHYCVGQMKKMDAQNIKLRAEVERLRARIAAALELLDSPTGLIPTALELLGSPTGLIPSEGRRAAIRCHSVTDLAKIRAALKGETP
jgi:hypothetical protein